MKVLLDENLPHVLRQELCGHDCYTVAYMHWSALENGALLAEASRHGFDALLTIDANLQYQQNLKALPMAVVVLHAKSNDIDDLRPLIPALLDALKSLKPKTVTHVV